MKVKEVLREVLKGKVEYSLRFEVDRFNNI